MKTPALAMLSLALLSLFTLTAQVEPAPDGVALAEPYVQAQSETASFCRTTRGSCEFYSHCIEPAFHCGSQGFAISYANQRCSAIRRLRPVGTSKYSVSRAARSWARDTETCLHTKLSSLLERYPEPHPDPQVCLDWEMDAIAELNSCYNDGSAAFLQLPDIDIRKLVELFRISDYYSPAVDASLVELIKTRSTTLASEVVRNHPLSSRHRIIVCIKGTEYLNGGPTEVMPSPEDYVQVVSNTLAEEERDYFHYAGPDQLANEVGGLCYNRSRDIDVNAINNDYHLVTWFTTDVLRADIERVNIRYRGDGNNQVNAVMFELTTTQHGNPHPQRKITQCGDGIRQVSESCDFTGSYPGCTIDCNVREGHDCINDRLAPSHCWKEACGDGRRTRGEECDDGNNMEQDGCSNSCRISDTYLCSQSYNSTSQCTTRNSRRAVPALHQPVPAKLISQVAGPVPSKDVLSSAEDTNERTVLSSGYRPTTSILPIILGMVGISIFSLR